MKKVIITLSIILVAVISYGAFIIISDVKDTEVVAEKEPIEKEEEIVTIDGEDHPEINEQESFEQTKEIGGIQYEIGLTSESSLQEIIDVMHKMTHQKIRAEDKWGAIPMTDNTINEVYEIVVNSDFSIKDDLIDILDKWKRGDFSEAHHDHNYFWDWQGGTIGKAYGLMTADEEMTFIQNNFKEYITDEENDENEEE